MATRRRKKLATANGERRHVEQIKSRDRVRDLAEVYTHEREVRAMLDLVPDMFPSRRDPGNTDRTFLEPACGHGNFLVEILHRKLKYVTPRRYGRGERLEHRALRCLASIYGIDICDDNVRESRERLRLALAEHVESSTGPEGPTSGFGDAVEAILATNIVCADTLAHAGEIELVEYGAGRGGTFTRKWSCLELSASEPKLCSLAPRRDEVPIHYSELSDYPDPVPLGVIAGEAA